MDPTETTVLGSTGLHPRIERGALEIGYWIRTDQTGKGLATEAARVLTWVAIEAVGAQRIEIRCDPENRASASIPKRLGCHLGEILLQNTSVSGELRNTMVWEMTAERFQDLVALPQD